MLVFIFVEGDVACVSCFAFGACSHVQATQGDIQHVVWLYACANCEDVSSEGFGTEMALGLELIERPAHFDCN